MNVADVGIEKDLITCNVINTAMYLEPRYKWFWFHKEIALALMDSSITHLIISLPPQHYKSTLINFYLLNLLGNDPDNTKAVICSYSSDLAEQHNYAAMKLFMSTRFRELFDINIDPRQQNKANWGISGHNGSFRAVGVGGSIYGQPATNIVIDDPIKPTDAYSQAVNDAADIWFKTEVVNRRQDENSKIIIIASMIGEGDFVGRRIKEGGWKVISIPAISCPNNRYEAQAMDDLEHGKPLMKTINFYLEQASPEGMGEIEFETQFQGNPCPRGELLLTSNEIIPILCAPKEGKKVRGWDIAYGAGKKRDSSATALLSRSDKDFYIENAISWKAPWQVTKVKVKQIILFDEPGTIQVFETNGGQETLVSDLKNDSELATYTIIGRFSSDDKASRAMPWLMRLREGRVKVVIGEWNKDFFAQLNHFTASSKHDDIIDSISKGWEILGKIIICPEGFKLGWIK